MKDFKSAHMTNEITSKGIIEFDGAKYERFTVKTHFVQINESYIDLVEKYIKEFQKPGDILAISEKIIALSQGRIIKKSDVKIGFWAKFLSKFVMKTKAGFSVGNVYKMQVAIMLAGLPRILFAAFCSAITKPFGVRGVFYKVAGHDINGLDGFYGGAFKEYEEIGILNPLKPNSIAQTVEDICKIGTAIVDANDLGCNILGKSLKLHYKEDLVFDALKDNPAGQSNQCTPFVIIRKVQE